MATETTSKTTPSTMDCQKKLSSDELEPVPMFIASRIELWDQLKAKHTQWVLEHSTESIKVTFQPGNGKPERKIPGKAWQTTPFNIARQVSVRSQLDRWLIARVNGELWDLKRPLESDCVLQLLTFDDEEGKRAFWKSCGLVLGQAAERRFGCLLVQSITQESGFGCDWAMPQAETGTSSTIKKSDYKPLHRLSHRVINQAHTFERLELGKQDLLAMFAYNKFKLHHVEQLQDDSTATVYKCGDHIDLSEGPHLPHAGMAKAFELVSDSSCYFLGDAEQESLQRMSGISFPTRKAFEEHKEWLEQAAKRDHRRIGRDQELFFFQTTISPGSAFWLPHGQRIYNTLMSYVREEYWKRGYQEVTTPNMFNSALWKQSGHWQHYKDDMFKFEIERDEWALKPMNCPGHCVLFGHRDRTFRELPLRISEFGILHRNEMSGALSGLTRVRRFVQDDTHIFCMESQVEKEVQDVLEWLTDFYHRICGFTFKVRLSTRPKDFLGDVETWDRAEAQLTGALNTLTSNTGMPWELNPSDGAFYGPKIDIAICDALKREHQCASIQLDFQLPQQFNLEYRVDQVVVNNHTKPSKTVDIQNEGFLSSEDVKAEHKRHDSGRASPVEEGSRTENIPQPRTLSTTESSADDKPNQPYRKPLAPGCARPVMIHRGIFGSFERFIAILCEHLAGKWPFWLSPRHVLVVPVTEIVSDYASEVQSALRSTGVHADVDLSRTSFTKKIRTGTVKDYNFIFVVGPAEKESRSVNIRSRDDQTTHRRGDMIELDRAVEVLQQIRREKQLSGKVKFL